MRIQSFKELQSIIHEDEEEHKSSESEDECERGIRIVEQNDEDEVVNQSIDHLTLQPECKKFSST